MFQGDDDDEVFELRAVSQHSVSSYLLIDCFCFIAGYAGNILSKI